MSSSIYTQVEEERHMHIQNANQVAPAALARAGVFTTGVEASKFLIDNDERARWALSRQMGVGPAIFWLGRTSTRGPHGSTPSWTKPRIGSKKGPSGMGSWARITCATPR